MRTIAYKEQLLIFKPLSYCFKEAIGFDVKATFTSRPLSRLIRWYNKPSDVTEEFWEQTIQFHGTFHGLKITNWGGRGCFNVAYIRKKNNFLDHKISKIFFICTKEAITLPFITVYRKVETGLESYK